MSDKTQISVIGVVPSWSIKGNRSELTAGAQREKRVQSTYELEDIREKNKRKDSYRYVMQGERPTTSRQQDSALVVHMRYSFRKTYNGHFVNAQEYTLVISR